MAEYIELHIPCDSCPSSDGKVIYADGHSFCFSCSKYTPKNEGFIDLEDKFTYEYLPRRGIDRGTMEFYAVKTKVNPEGKPISLGFRYPDGSYKVRSLEKKEFHTVGEVKAGLFGKDKFDAGSHKYVTITEGEYDALSLWQALRSPVVSVRSSTSALRDCSAERSWLQSFERIYLAFDSDAPGREAAASVAKLFDYNKVYLVKFNKRKDANEYTQVGEEDELRNIWNNSRKYQPETIVSSLSDFKAILSEAPKWGVPYPYPTLTQMTYGIRTSEAVLITAQEGVGKTSLMHAIEYKILKETDHAVGAIFLEEPKRDHLHALATIELQKPCHLPDSGVTQDEIDAALGKVIKEDDRLFIYSHFGSDDPEVLLDIIRYLVSARGARYILLDHITMAVSGLRGGDERLALDYLSSRLEMMVQELDFALIVVSHVNDEGLTRGSRYISKLAHTRIDMLRDTKNGDLNTYLTVSKNRYAHKTGPAGKLTFDPLTYALTETYEDERHQHTQG